MSILVFILFFVLVNVGYGEAMSVALGEKKRRKILSFCWLPLLVLMISYIFLEHLDCVLGFGVFYILFVSMAASIWLAVMGVFTVRQEQRAGASTRSSLIATSVATVPALALIAWMFITG